MRRFGFLALVMVAGAAVSLLAAPAQAACPTPVTAGLGGGPSLYYGAYLNFGDNGPDGAALNAYWTYAAPGEVIGRFWETAAPSNTSDPMTADQWVFGIAGYPQYWSFYVNLGSGTPAGNEPACVAGEALTVYLENTDSHKSAVMTQTLQGGQNVDINFSGCGGTVAGNSLRPRATSSSRAGTDVTLNFSVPAPTNCDLTGGSGAITGINVYTLGRAKVDGAPAGDTSAESWTLGTTVSAGGGTGSVVVDCSTTSNYQWVATGLVVNGTAAPFLSPATSIECDPNLAEPSGSFKLIPHGNDRPKGKKDK